MSWIRRTVLPAAIAVTIAAAATEGGAWLLSRKGLLPVNDTPRAYLPLQARQIFETEWRTEQDDWGAWHRPNATGQGIRPCFRVDYTTNSIGARDDEFSPWANGPRVLLLGDSFAEGIGVSAADTAQAQLEKLIGQPVLNFGAGGDLGPLQYWLLYDRLAQNYPHDSLLVFLLPDNDFTDNDYTFWKQTGGNLIGDGTDAERWRPYYRQTADGFEPFYPEKGRQRDRWTAYTPKAFELKRWAYEHLWSFNVLRSIKLILLSRRVAAARDTEAGTYSGYFDATDEQQRAVVYFMTRIFEQSRAKNLYLVAIPRPADLQRIHDGADRSVQLWWSRLDNLGASLPGKQYHFIDLADSAPADALPLFHTCDGHWSIEGNKWAAGRIAAAMRP